MQRKYHVGRGISSFARHRARRNRTCAARTGQASFPAVKVALQFGFLISKKHVCGAPGCPVIHKNFFFLILPVLYPHLHKCVQVIDFTCLRCCPSFGHFVVSRIPTRFRDVKPWLFHKVIHKLCGYPKKFFNSTDLALTLRKLFELAKKRARHFYDSNVGQTAKMHLRGLTGQIYSCAGPLLPLLP